MATTFGGTTALARASDKELPHRVRLGLASALAFGGLLALAFWGRDYYPLDAAARADSPLHPVLRPSGVVGIRLGVLGVIAFLILALYPLRKRWRWLNARGTTRHWLDFHSLVGIVAPLLITFHSTFKFQGLAGAAYWIMVAVALSGFIGRFLYSQVPRHLNATAMDMNDLSKQAEDLAQALDHQCLIPVQVLAPMLEFPSPPEVRRMSLLGFLVALVRLDIRRSWLVIKIRRRLLRRWQKVTTLGGVLRSSNTDLEAVITAARRQSWLGAKIAFLHRVQQAFHLWHVVHRPFSISFAFLVIIHIGVVISMGYF